MGKAQGLKGRHGQGARPQKSRKKPMPKNQDFLRKKSFSKTIKILSKIAEKKRFQNLPH
jgi:hypothetical protein